MVVYSSCMYPHFIEPLFSTAEMSLSGSFRRLSHDKAKVRSQNTQILGKWHCFSIFTVLRSEILRCDWPLPGSRHFEAFFALLWDGGKSFSWESREMRRTLEKERQCASASKFFDLHELQKHEQIAIFSWSSRHLCIKLTRQGEDSMINTWWRAQLRKSLQTLPVELLPRKIICFK